MNVMVQGSSNKVFLGCVSLVAAILLIASIISPLKLQADVVAESITLQPAVELSKCSRSALDADEKVSVDFKGFEKLKFLDSIPKLHPLIKEQWKKFNKSLDDSGRFTKECFERATRFTNNEVPDHGGRYYKDYGWHIHNITIRNGKVLWSHDQLHPREKDLGNFLNALYEANPDLPDIFFWESMGDGALCAPWLTENCALPMLVHEAGMDCASWLATSRPTVVTPIYFQEPNFSTWHQKLEIAVWRGTTTGGAGWSMQHQGGIRFKLVNLSLEHPHLLDAKFSGIVQTDNQELIQYLQDTGRLCRTCLIDSSSWHKWKYLVVVDGNSNADRFPYFLATGSVVLRQEWVGLEVFEYGLKPWVHYIPVKRDLSDLIEKIEWAKSHDEQCKQIAMNAWCYIDKAFTHPGTTEYWRGFIKAYAEIVPRV
eukprot:TRINITY_DN54949_c0_g2_i1.p1 TRINITY_DN54949_c0_g2~~TRINITY_DN54949_c0_g2_i1.p1  ORF type:complete len:426 (-),score=84.93 TRINITY_DN54949_c0_g2_i1:47-1324(-)